MILFEHFGWFHRVERKEDMPPVSCVRMRRQGRRGTAGSEENSPLA